MAEALLFVGLLAAVLVGFNISDSSTGVSFDPAVGSGALGKLAAAALMTGSALLGGWTLEREVVAKMGGEIAPQSKFTLTASVTVLFFVGLTLLVSNTFDAPVSMSMTAVRTIAGLDLTNGSLDSRVVFEIISWWIAALVIAFWICAIIDRHIYPYLDAWLKLGQSPGALVRLDRDDGFPRPRPDLNATYRKFGGAVLVVIIACYMVFSAGVLSIANTVTPLVSNGALEMNADILIAGGAIGLGAFAIARQTLDTIGNGLTQLLILTALIVETVSAPLISFLSAIDIPASLTVSTTMYIVGLGWGRTTRTVALGETLSGSKTPQISVNAPTVEREDEVPEMNEEAPDGLSAQDLFDPGTIGQAIFFWMLTPSLSALASYALFSAGIIWSMHPSHLSFCNHHGQKYNERAVAARMWAEFGARNSKV